MAKERGLRAGFAHDGMEVAARKRDGDVSGPAPQQQKTGTERGRQLSCWNC